MSAFAWFLSGLGLGLTIGGALLADATVKHQGAMRELRRLVPQRPRLVGHYSGANSPHPKGHPCLYVEVQDEAAEAWRAIGGPAA